ncbi:hypothetical protein Glove_319g47 [Diversispora epigaea]|uniref:Uncharacterized protein n=1 Tax=Diversispora epigaea TaxID=1348612 RepID=A0A397HQ45_9GLOM|nr:hypothetical protein Glove_319g47 [Diversispora epigaea]
MYKNNQLPLLWYCKEGHLWQASLGNYLGLPSENRRSDFVKIPKHPKGLGLDILPRIWLCNRSARKNTLNSFIPIILSRKNYATFGIIPRQLRKLT